jgi:hypothetical protein
MVTLFVFESSACGNQQRPSHGAEKIETSSFDF